jgi:hypothetical protein
MVKDSVRGMRDFARGAAPHRTDLLAEHIKDEDIVELADLIEGRLGVTRVEEADGRTSRGRYRRSQYPLFVEGGTQSPIFSARTNQGGLMWNPAEGIFGRKQVRGQDAKPFMFATYVQAREILRADPQVGLALREMAAEAEAMKAGMEAT